MNQHTKGPWDRIIADGYTVRHPQIYSDTGPVANATWLGDGRLDELNANARLISAAPELLEALKGMLEQFNYHTTTGINHEESEAIAKARAAIAKAGGAV